MTILNLFLSLINTPVIRLVLDSDDSDSNILLLLYALPFVLAFFVLKSIYAKYRNTNKRHEYEKETDIIMLDLDFIKEFRSSDSSREKIRDDENGTKPGVRTLPCKEMYDKYG